MDMDVPHFLILILVVRPALSFFWESLHHQSSQCPFPLPFVKTPPSTYGILFYDQFPLSTWLIYRPPYTPGRSFPKMALVTMQWDKSPVGLDLSKCTFSLWPLSAWCPALSPVFPDVQWVTHTKHITCTHMHSFQRPIKFSETIESMFIVREGHIFLTTISPSLIPCPRGR